MEWFIVSYDENKKNSKLWKGISNELIETFCVSQSVFPRKKMFLKKF